MDEHSQQRLEYPNPPIQEGLVQFNFVEPMEWSVATPGLVYQQLRTEYPGEPEQQEQVEASFQLQDVGNAAGITLNKKSGRIIYRNHDRTRLVVLSSTTVSVNSLQPYEGWPSLEKRLREVGDYLERAGVDPQVQSVSTRYINRIRIATGGVIDLEDFFLLKVNASAHEGAVTTAFVTRSESLIRGSGTKIAITFGSADNSAETPPGAADFVLDIEVSRENSDGWSRTEAQGVAKELKLLENTEFEAAITDQCRSLFK